MKIEPTSKNFLILFFIIVNLAVLIVVVLKEPPIKYDALERLDDMRNVTSRDTFCQSKGYEYSLLVDFYPQRSYNDAPTWNQVPDLDVWIAGATIQCGHNRIAAVDGIGVTHYNYEQYKKWLIANNLSEQ